MIPNGWPPSALTFRSALSPNQARFVSFWASVTLRQRSASQKSARWPQKCRRSQPYARDCSLYSGKWDAAEAWSWKGVTLGRWYFLTLTSNFFSTPHPKNGDAAGTTNYNNRG